MRNQILRWICIPFALLVLSAGCGVDGDRGKGDSDNIADCFFYPGYDNYKNFDIKEMYPISDRQKEMFDHLDDIPVNMRALTIFPSAVRSRDFVKNLINGSMSASDASDQVLKTVKYRYFE